MKNIHQQIEGIIDAHPVVLFMKGTEEKPTCGFSATASKLLKSLGVDFYYIDVMNTEAMREGVKSFSSWPTLPQLYINREFIGGCDVMRDLHRAGELQKMLEAYIK